MKNVRGGTPSQRPADPLAKVSLVFREEKGGEERTFTYQPSTRKNKKLMVVATPSSSSPQPPPSMKAIHFGDARHGHFHDQTGLWAHLDHHDETRRAKYHKRHAALSSKTIDDPSTAAYHAARVFW